jgi:hypothetical protein
MPYRTLSVRSIGVGSKELGSAILTLQRDDPEPGVRGLKSWQFSGQTDRAGLLPEEAELTATLHDGRELSGLAILTSHRIDMAVTWVYRGTGPLHGTTDADYD